MENRYKKIREDFEFTENGYRMTQEKLADIFKQKGYPTLNHSAIRKIETGNRKVTEYELKGYCEVFKTTSDYLLGIRNTKPVDENLAMISEVTGLNEDAIATLKRLKSNDGCTYIGHNEMNTLNFLLSSYIDIAELLAHIQDFFFTSHKIPVFHTGKLKNIDGVVTPECIVPDNKYDVIKTKNTETRLLSLAQDKNDTYNIYQITLNDTFFEGIALKSIEKKLRDYLEIFKEE